MKSGGVIGKVGKKPPPKVAAAKPLTKVGQLKKSALDYIKILKRFKGLMRKYKSAVKTAKMKSGVLQVRFNIKKVMSRLTGTEKQVLNMAIKRFGYKVSGNELLIFKSGTRLSPRPSYFGGSYKARAGLPSLKVLAGKISASDKAYVRMFHKGLSGKTWFFRSTIVSNVSKGAMDGFVVRLYAVDAYSITAKEYKQVALKVNLKNKPLLAMDRMRSINKVVRNGGIVVVP
jgi:hypothetical protein